MNTRHLRARVGISMILFLLVLIFGAQNVGLVDIHFLRWRFEIPRSVLISIVLLVGVFIGWSARTLGDVFKCKPKNS
ncbi:lipopolysaccharide assembly protein LapA domain-containing protein [Granulosicoccus antarcticus]|nr:LapA family protein [Granulosicoccus antarcticus]